MHDVACKLCLLGAPGVGKTSLAQRLLHDRFPAGPASPGITVAATGLTSASGESLPVTIWDVSASSAIDTLNQAFLSRVDGIAAIVDSTVAASVAGALAMIAHVRALHPSTAAALIVNKRDLAHAAAAMPELPPDVPCFAVSARDGAGVGVAFAALAHEAVRNRRHR